MMRSTVLLAVLACAVGCSKDRRTTTPSAGGGGAALDKDLLALVGEIGSVDRIKIRVDSRGAIVKQAVYHHDATAIPPAVHDVAKQTWPDGKVLYYESELYADLGRIYEVEVESASGMCEIAARADGTLHYKECRMDPASLPAPINARVDELWPGGKVLEAETKQGAEIDEVSVEVEHEGREHYLRVRPDGTVIQKLRRVPAVIEIPLP